MTPDKSILLKLKPYALRIAICQLVRTKVHVVIAVAYNKIKMSQRWHFIEQVNKATVGFCVGCGHRCSCFSLETGENQKGRVR